jgi:potassium-transporting ATPase potassium-binding subunit
VRGIARQSVATIGNFWADVVRVTYYLLVPICLVFALFLVSQGVIQNFKPYRCEDLRAVHDPGAEDDAAGKPVMAADGKTPVLVDQSVDTRRSCRVRRLADRHQDAWDERRRLRQRQRGASLRESHAALQLPADALDLRDPERPDLLPRAHGEEPEARLGRVGRDVRDVPRGRAGLLEGGEPRQPDPQALGVAADGNMEGKEVRFGIFNSALFATITTDASCGAVNSMHDSFTPLGGMVPLFNIETGEVIFGGVGAGLYGMLIFVVLAVFIAGLMVGRTPEYLGKKIEAYDVKLVMLVLMVLSATILGFTAWASVADWGRAGLNNAGPHGFSEILYAFSSCVGNNGSAFGGRRADPGDGEIVEGIASVDESAITGRVGARSSASRAATAARSPAARACSPTGSSSASPPSPGETFLDRMIALVEGAKRQKTPNEIALNILLAA